MSTLLPLPTPGSQALPQDVPNLPTTQQLKGPGSGLQHSAPALQLATGLTDQWRGILAVNTLNIIPEYNQSVSERKIHTTANLVSALAFSYLLLTVPNHSPVSMSSLFCTISYSISKFPIPIPLSNFFSHTWIMTTASKLISPIPHSFPLVDAQIRESCET